MLAVARPASQGLLEPYLLGPEAERRWQKRRLKWIFGFIDTDGTGALPVQKINLLWHELKLGIHQLARGKRVFVICVTNLGSLARHPRTMPRIIT